MKFRNRSIALLFILCTFCDNLFPADLTYEDSQQFSAAFQAGNYTTLSIPGFNLQLGKFEDWENTGVQKKNNALYLNFKQKSGATLTVIAMDIGFFPPESFAEVKNESEMFLRSSYPDRQVTLKQLRESKIGDLGGFVREVETKAGSPAFHEIMWDGSRNGFNYILRYRFPPGDAGNSATVWQKISGLIRFPDATAVSPRFEKDKPQDVQSDAYGYRIKAAGTYFTALPQNGKSNAKPEHAFSHSQRTGIGYFPTVIRNKRLSPAEILQGMLSGLEVSKDITLGKISAGDSNSLTVARADGVGTGELREFVYEIRLHAKAPVYVLELIGEQTFDKGKRRPPQRLPFVLQGRSGEIRDTDFSEEQRRRHFHFLMKIGMHLKGESKYALAKDFFEEAITQHVDDSAAVNQLCSAFEKLKNYSAGYAITEQYKEIADKNPNLLSYKAFFAYKLEKYKEAAKLYEASFEQGYWAADEFEFMLKALAADKQMDKADQLSEKYLALQKNEDLMRYVVRFLRDEKRFKKAEAVIADAEKKFGLTEKIGFDYGKVYFDQNKYSEGVQICERLEKAGFTDPVIKLNKGIFYYSLKDYVRAREALRQYQSMGGQEQSAANYLKSIDELLEKTPAVYTSADYAYRLKIAGTGFRTWENFATEMSNAEYGLLYDEYGGMAVFSLQTDRLNPKKLTSADFLAMINPEHAKAMGKPVRQATVSGAPFEEFHYTMKTENRQYAYRVRLLQRGHFQHAVFLWYAEAAGEAEERSKLFGIADNFVFDETAAPQKLTSRNRRIQSYLTGRLGEIHFKAGDMNKSLHNLSYAHETDPANTAAFNLLLQTLSRLQDFSRLYDLALAAEKKSPKDQAITSWKAFALYKTERLTEAASVYAGLFSAGYWNEHDFRDYADILARTGKEDELLKQLEEKYKLYPTPDLGLTLANYLRKFRKYDKAEARYKALIAENPKNADARLELGWLYIDTDSPTKTIEICDELIRQKIQTVPVEYLKGVALYKLGRYREAKGSFEFVVRANPKDAEARNYLNYVTSILGQGQNSNIQAQIQPVDIPQGYQVSPQAEKDDVASVFHRTTKAVYFKKGETERMTYYYGFSILKDAGIANHSKYVFTFDPLRERIFVNKLEVRDAQNNIKAQGKSDEYYVIDEVDDSNITTGKKELQIVVPGLVVGSRVELMVSRETLQPVRQLSFGGYNLSQSTKVQRAELYVCGNLKDIASFEMNLAPAKTERDCKSWKAENPAILARESLRAPSKAFAPIVYLGSNDQNWRDLNRDYFAKINDRLKTDETMTKLSAQIVGDASTREQKLRRLTQYVQNTIKYQAIEFGTRGVIPNYPTKTLADKFGDCKDQSVLLHTLLKAQGIESELALIHTHAAFVESIPSLDQFNHMIVYLPGEKGGTFFDPTQKNFGVNPLPPIYLQGQTAMLVRESGPKFPEIAPPARHRSRISINREIRLKKDQAVIRETITWTDYHAAFVRGYFRKHEAKPLVDAVHGLIGNDLRGAKITSAKIKGMDTLSSPLTLEISMAVVLSDPDSDTQVLHIPSYWEKEYISVPGIEKRQTPFHFEYPISLQRKLTFHNAPGIVAKFAGKSKSVSSEFFQFKSAQTKADEALVHELVYENQAGTHGPEKYAKLKQDSDAVMGFLAESVILRHQKNAGGE